MTVKVRFAPAPTGRLHVGNIRTAVTNWLFAKSHGGQFVLRIDDTDVERSREEYVEGIRDDLRWLGLEWDQEERQSARAAIHQAAADKLKTMGHEIRMAGRQGSAPNVCHQGVRELDRAAYGLSRLGAVGPTAKHG